MSIVILRFKARCAAVLGYPSPELFRDRVQRLGLPLTESCLKHIRLEADQMLAAIRIARERQTA